MSSVQPPAPYTPPPAAAPPPADGEAVPAEITRLPPGLSSTDRAVALKGEVQAQNPDGSIRITTPRGPVDVRLPEPLPARGQSVDIQILAGSPPRNATVTLPAQQAQPPVQTAPPPTAQPPAATPLPPAVTLPSAPAQTQPPIPGQTPAPPATGAPPAPGPAIGQPASLGPQGLMTFLKTSLQNIMKAPGAETPPPAPANALPVPGAAAQRPLQIGQLTRLTPLPAGQALQPMPAAPGSAAGMPANPVMGTPGAAPILGMPASGSVALPASALAPSHAAPSMQQMLLQTVAGNTLMPAGGGNITMDPVARLLLPITAATSATPPPAGAPAAQAQTILTQLASNATAQHLTGHAQAGSPTALHAPATPQLHAMPGHLTPGHNIDVRVGAMLQSMPVSALQTPGAATLLQGTPMVPALFAQVAGQAPGGLPALSLPTFTTGPDGMPRPAMTMMTLQFPAKGLTQAAILKLDVLPAPAGQIPAAAIAAPGVTGMAGGTLGANATWAALDEILRGPAAPGGQNAQSAVAAALPKPGAAAFTAPVMMLAAAMRGGDIAAWMGEKGIEGLRNARTANALARVGADFSTNARAAFDDARPAGEWRAITLPLAWGQEVARVQMHYHSFERDSDDPNAPGKTKGARFVMDLSLMRMGPLQIDGFSIGRKLDVTLRSEQPLSPGMREAMRQRYSAVIATIGFAGELNFSAAPGRKGWVAF